MLYRPNLMLGYSNIDVKLYLSTELKKRCSTIGENKTHPPGQGRL